MITSGSTAVDAWEVQAPFVSNNSTLSRCRNANKTMETCQYKMPFDQDRTLQPACCLPVSSDHSDGTSLNRLANPLWMVSIQRYIFRPDNERWSKHCRWLALALLASFSCLASNALPQQPGSALHKHEVHSWNSRCPRSTYSPWPSIPWLSPGPLKYHTRFGHLRTGYAAFRGFLLACWMNLTRTIICSFDVFVQKKEPRKIVFGRCQS